MLSPSRAWPLCAAMAGASTLALAAAARAESAPPFAVLLAQARESAPRLRESAAEVDQARGLARQATAAPNPTLSVEVENFAGRGPYRGDRSAETTASVEQLIELGGKRHARVAAARAELSAARARAGRASADYAFDLAAAYAGAEAAGKRVELAQEALRTAEEDQRIASALVRAGKEAEVRAVQARAALQAARAALSEAQVEQAGALATLSALSGAAVAYTSTPDDLLAHAERVEGAPRPDPTRSPAYLAARAERDAAARRIAVERAKAAPDVTVSVGARRFEAEDASALVAGVSVPFPIFDRNRGNLAAAQAELRAAEARLEAARLDALADAAAAGARLDAAQSRIAAAREGEQAAAEASRLAGVGYEAGKFSLLELLAARRALAEARAEHLQAQLDRLTAEAAIARLQGLAPFGDQR